MSLLKAISTVGGLTALSRVAGFIRDVMTAAILGAGPVADAFFVALKLPNFFRRITAEGAFSVSFIPLYSKALERDGAEQANNFASNAFSIMLSALSVFVLVCMIVMPQIIALIAPGFESGGQRELLAIDLSRITFAYLLFMSLSALLGGVLNAHHRFAPFAFAPVLFNLCLIGGLLLSGFAHSAGHAMAYGIFAAGILQFGFLWVCVKRAGLSLRLRRPVFDPQTKKLFTLMGPGVIGAGVMHINLFADLVMASFLPKGSISYLYYADRLNQLPLGIVGIAIGTALLPMLSKALENKEMEEAGRLFNRALEYALLLALPAAVALMVMPSAIIEVLFQRGAFTPEDTAATSLVLALYALGLPSYICIKVFSTAHWAREDTKTPVKIAIIATVLNIIISLIMIQFIGVAGIALGTALTGWLQVWLHLRVLKDYAAVRFDARFLRNIVKIIVSSAVMGLVLAAMLLVLPTLSGQGLMTQIMMLGGLITGGLIIYGGCVLLSGAIKTSDLKRLVKKA